MDGSLDCYAHQQSDGEDEDMIIDEVGHLLSLREYQALDIDLDPLTLEAWIHDLADGTDLGDGWSEVSVPHFQPRGASRTLHSTRSCVAREAHKGGTRRVRWRTFGGERPASQPLEKSRSLVA